MADKISELCKWLHEQLEPLELIKYPFKPENLPKNGIYFFYEDGEVWGHGGRKPRIVRIGTHLGNGGFGRRINQHFSTSCSAHTRSVFRKHIGSALLKKRNDKYLKIWHRHKKYKTQRNRKKEEKIEQEVSETIGKKFKFKVIIVNNSNQRKRLEKSLIGTIAQCDLCKPSKNWLGRLSPEDKIKESGLWQTQHLKANVITKNDKKAISDAY